MLYYLGRRLVALLPTIIVPMILLFVLLRMAPGNPAYLMLGDEAPIEAVEALTRQLGLDQPLPLQFVAWLRQLATFSLGDSLFLHAPVTEVLAKRIPVTLELSVMSLIISGVVGALAGAIAAVKHQSIADRGLVLMFAIGRAVPNFWLALLLVTILAVQVRWFPVLGYTPHDAGFLPWLRSMALPALSLGLVQAATIFRFTRASLLDVMNESYVQTARALGLPERIVIFRYVFRMAALPVLTVMGLTFAYALGGTAVLETMFSLPGLGQLLLAAAIRRDYPLIQGAILYVALTFVFVNLGIDLLYAALDPRIRQGRADQ